MYKVIGAVIVALAIAAALLPLWLGSGGPEKTEVVRVRPKALEQPKEEPGADSAPEQQSAPESGGASDQGGSGAEGDEPWWVESKGKESPESGSAASGSQPAGADSGPSAPEGSGTEEPASDGGAPEEEGRTAAAPEPAEGAASREGAGDGAASPETAPKEEAEAPEPAPGSGQEQKVARAEPPFWAVMVGSFQDPGNARGLRDRLRDEGFAAQVRTSVVEGREWNRVLVGAVDSKEEAEKLLPRLEEAGYGNTLVMKVE